MVTVSKRRRQEHDNGDPIRGVLQILAERVGFEPTEVLPSHDFQSCALDRTMLPLLALPGGSGPIIPPLPARAKSRCIRWSPQSVKPAHPPFQVISRSTNRFVLSLPFTCRLKLARADASG